MIVSGVSSSSSSGSSTVNFGDNSVRKGYTFGLLRLSTQFLLLIQLSLLLATLEITLVTESARAQDAFDKIISERIIETKYGKIRGVQILFRKDLLLRPVDAYLGIPYASFRKDAMRFMPPGNPPFRWDGTSPVLKRPPVCPQKLMDESALKDAKVPKYRKEYLRRIRPLLVDQEEDCLKLNVYVPRQGELLTPAVAPFICVQMIYKNK